MRISEISDIRIRWTSVSIIKFNVVAKWISESDFHCFSLSDCTFEVDNIRHYPYPFSVELFKRSNLFSGLGLKGPQDA
jgi:hypothetical protein